MAPFSCFPTERVVVEQLMSGSLLPRDRARLKLTGIQVTEASATRFQAGAGRRAVIWSSKPRSLLILTWSDRFAQHAGHALLIVVWFIYANHSPKYAARGTLKSAWTYPRRSRRVVAVLWAEFFLYLSLVPASFRLSFLVLDLCTWIHVLLQTTHMNWNFPYVLITWFPSMHINLFYNVAIHGYQPDEHEYVSPCSILWKLWWEFI
jgi:hypothetical protein